MKDGHIKHKKTGLCVTTTDVTYKTPITLEKCRARSRAQKWSLNRQKDFFGIESYLKMNAKDNCLDVPGFSGVKGLKAQMCGCQLHDKDNMLYALVNKKLTLV